MTDQKETIENFKTYYLDTRYAKYVKNHVEDKFDNERAILEFHAKYEDFILEAAFAGVEKYDELFNPFRHSEAGNNSKALNTHGLMCWEVAQEEIRTFIESNIKSYLEK